MALPAICFSSLNAYVLMNSLMRTAECFSQTAWSELQKAYAKQTDKDASFEAIFKEFTEKKIVGGTYAYRASLQKKYADTDGGIDFFYINGKLYMFEYVITTVSFVTMFKPFLILLACPCSLCRSYNRLLASIKPYRQYKRAYENNIFKNNLIDSLAHNMKTPLQILGGYAENLKDVTSDAEKDRYADQILAKTSEMNRDIEAILKTAERSDRKLTKSLSVHVSAKLPQNSVRMFRSRVMRRSGWIRNTSRLRSIACWIMLRNIRARIPRSRLILHAMQS